MRCIVTNLTEDSTSELSDELVKGAPLVLDDSCDADDDMENWESWQPDPVDADPGEKKIYKKNLKIGRIYKFIGICLTRLD